MSKIQQAQDIFSAIVSAPFGPVGVQTAGGLVTGLFYLPAGVEEKAPSDSLAERAAGQVLRYCADADFPFDLPLARVGSDYQRKVWAAISSIPRGQVRTYGELAKHVGSVARAVGQACGANAFPLVIPCHRVTGTQGLGGFAGDDNQAGFTLGIKRWLLAHEGHREYAWQQATLL